MNRNALSAYVEYLQSFPRFSAKEYLALERIAYLLKLLGNPEKNMTGVQIAGTNGKGSVAATLDAILHKAGYNVLTFTSPHLVSPVERFRLNGKPISEKKLVGLATAIKPFAKKVERKLHDRPTWFEVMVAMAVLLAKKNKVDLLVCEVGLGGRLDATTALHLPVKVITSISHDHTHILGTTLAAITKEKAGIINRTEDRVITANSGTALRVIRERCLSVDARLTVLRDGKDFAWKGTDWRGTTFAVRNVPRPFRTPLLGRHQAENAALALSALQELATRGFPTTKKDVRQGLAAVHWPGRMQRIRQRGTNMLLDGAHNPGAACALARTVRDLRLRKNDLAVIIGLKETKNAQRAVPVLASLGRTVCFPRLDEIEHMSKPENLNTIWSKGIIVDSWQEALKLAKQQGARYVLITGSLYLIGNVLAKLSNKQSLGLRDDTFPITTKRHGRSR